MDAESFKQILQQEFLRRSSKNSQYSLRSYAQFLEVHHSTLSGLLSGKRPITRKTVSALSLKLGLYPDSFSRSKNFNLPKHEILEEDTFNRISEWYFDAILELSKLKNFDFTVAKISRYLSLNEVQVSAAIQTLLRLNLLKKTKNGSLKATYENSTNLSSNEKTSLAMRRYQRSILDKSLEALESVNRIDRDHTSTTLAIRKSDLPKAKQIIKDFRYKLTTLLQQNDSFDEVYQLQVSLFPLGKRK